MLKGKLYYDNKNIKYCVKMEDCGYDYYISIKTKLGKFSLFTYNLILDIVSYKNPFNDDNYVKEYEVKRLEFLNKWDKMSNSDIVKLVEKFIKKEIDKDNLDNKIETTLNGHMENFNTRSYYVNKFLEEIDNFKSIPKAPRKIPMPECKEHSDIKLIKAKLDYIESILDIMLEDE